MSPRGARSVIERCLITVNEDKGVVRGCRKVVDKLSELDESFDDRVVECNCRSYYGKWLGSVCHSVRSTGKNNGGLQSWWWNDQSSQRKEGPNEEGETVGIRKWHWSRSQQSYISQGEAALNIKLLEPLAQGASRFEKLLAPRKIYWPPFSPDRRLYSWLITHNEDKVVRNSLRKNVSTEVKQYIH